jgi:archaellum component FlaC
MIDDDIDNLKKQLKDTQKQIDEIQNECKHTKTKLAFVASGTNEVIKRCVDCESEVGYPTEEERDDFLK